jgi:hypothetical protein
MPIVSLLSSWGLLPLVLVSNAATRSLPDIAYNSRRYCKVTLLMFSRCSTMQHQHNRLG